MYECAHTKNGAIRIGDIIRLGLSESYSGGQSSGVSGRRCGGGRWGGRRCGGRLGGLHCSGHPLHRRTRGRTQRERRVLSLHV